MFSLQYSIRAMALSAAFAGLLFIGGCGDADDNPATHHHNHLEAVGTRLIHESDTLCTVDGTAVSGGLALTAGDTLQPIQVWFLDEDGDWLQPDSDDTDHALDIQVADTSVAKIVLGRNLAAPHTAWSIAAVGRAAGTTSVRMIVIHEDHPDYTSPEIPVTVTTP